jgi:hypothetical protein
VLLLGWSFLCRTAIDFFMKERKKVRKRKQINKRSAAISTRLIERQWVPSMCWHLRSCEKYLKSCFLCRRKEAAFPLLIHRHHHTVVVVILHSSS